MGMIGNNPVLGIVSSGNIQDGAVTPPKLANSGSEFGFRNRIINGDMRIAQRGNVVLSANGIIFGGPDRFFLSIGGFSTVSVIALQAGAVFPGSANCYQIGNLNTTGGPGIVSVIQRIESVDTYDLSGQPVTITVKVLQQTGAALNAQLVLRKANAFNNFASVSLIAASGPVAVPDSTITTLTFTTTLGASDAANGLQVELYFPTVSATASKQIYVSQWQLEAGRVATPFERREYSRELAMCQRYYATGFAGWIGSTFTSTLVGQFIEYPVTMRSSPVITLGTPTESNNVGTVYLGPGIDSGFRIYTQTPVAAQSYYTNTYAASAEF